MFDDDDPADLQRRLNHAITIGLHSAISFRDAAELNRKAYDAARLYAECGDTPVQLYCYTLHSFLDGFRDGVQGKPALSTRTRDQYQDTYLEGYKHAHRYS